MKRLYFSSFGVIFSTPRVEDIGYGFNHPGTLCSCFS